MLYLALALLHVGARMQGAELAGIRQRGRYQGTFATKQILRLLVEMILRHGIHTIDSGTHLDAVEINLHDALLAPHQFYESKFEWRCDGFDRMGMAGVHSIGMGVLIGLEKEWRTDVVMMAHHLRYLQKHYWKTKYSVNFPRMRPAQNEGFQPNCFMTDKQLAQATFAMRIFDHDVDISYSTREPAYIRDNMATLGVTTMSAESKVNPGGYHTYPQALEQFTVSDERTAKVINARLKELGREPVWKDWDASFDFFGNIANG